ncbi:MAG: ABC transporter ATP-binding protein [Nannocystaceae bacterium]
MTAALSVRNLIKSYGDIKALKGMSIEVPRGRLFGVVGPNGAGKTTLFSVISGFLPADSGVVEIAGQRLAKGQPPPKGKLAILPQDALFIAGLNLGLQLRHYGELQGLNRQRAREEARRVLALVGLEEVHDRKARTLSHGMHKRVGIAQAFIGDPDVVILDEPTAGLDPHAAREIRALLRKIQDNRTVIVSSHNLGEVEDLCNEVAILDKGELVRQDSIEGMIGGADIVVFRLTRGIRDTELDTLRALNFVTEVTWSEDDDRLRVGFDTEKQEAGPATRDMVSALVDAGIAFVEVQVGKSLEERFLEETRRKS